MYLGECISTETVHLIILTLIKICTISYLCYEYDLHRYILQSRKLGLTRTCFLPKKIIYSVSKVYYPHMNARAHTVITGSKYIDKIISV